MRLRVLGVLSLVSLLMVVGASFALLTSASRELTQELQINRAAALNRFAQVASDAALDNDTTQLTREMDRYSELYGEGIIIRLQDETLSSGGLIRIATTFAPRFPARALTSATPRCPCCSRLERAPK